MIIFEVDDPWSDMLQVQVYDTNDDSPDQKILLGSCVVPLIGLKRNHETNKWYSLMGPSSSGGLSPTGAEINLGLNPLDYDPPEIIAQYQGQTETAPIHFSKPIDSHQAPSPQQTPQLYSLSSPQSQAALPTPPQPQQTPQLYSLSSPQNQAALPSQTPQTLSQLPQTPGSLVLTPSLQLPPSLSLQQQRPSQTASSPTQPTLQLPSLSASHPNLIPPLSPSQPNHSAQPAPSSSSTPINYSLPPNNSPSTLYQPQMQIPQTQPSSFPPSSPVAQQSPVQHQAQYTPQQNGHTHQEASPQTHHVPQAPHQMSPVQSRGQSPPQESSPKLVPIPALATQMPSHNQPPRTGLINFHPNDLKREFPHIAKGSFGVVFKGTAKGFSQVVVIKDLEIQNQKSVDEWRKEITLMSTVRSPYIVPVYGFCSNHNILTIVMELMALGDLYQILHKKADRHPLSMLQRMRMARHCAGGLACLHSNRIIHRDVKSMNILVSEDYSAKLTDFGCSKLVPEGRVLHTANSGTPLWMAPEVKRGQYSFSADMYSLGLVLYELFERKLPQYDQNRQTVILPQNFQSCTVVMPCLNPIASQRPGAQQVVGVLDKMINHLVVSVRVMLPQHEQDMFKEETEKKGIGKDAVDLELMQLYRYLLQKPAAEVDQLISRVFNIGPSEPKPPIAKHPLPSSQPRYQPTGLNPNIPSYAPPVNYGGRPTHQPFKNNNQNSDYNEYANQLRQLADMGFDRERALPLLKKYDGNVERVADHLIGG